MSTLNINTIDNEFTSLRSQKKSIVELTNKGLKTTVKKVIDTLNTNYELSGNFKSARNTTKKQLLKPLYQVVVNKRGVETDKLICDDNTLRGYNIAFTVIFRSVNTILNHTSNDKTSLEYCLEWFSVTQFENIVTYFTKSEIEYLNGVTFSDTALEHYKKTIKQYQKTTTTNSLDTKHKKVSTK